MLSTGVTPDFITVDGGEGGTGAAPPEFSNSVGVPMAEGLTLVHGILLGAGLRDEVRVTAAGKIVTGFNVVRTLALGADTCSAARAMLFAVSRLSPWDAKRGPIMLLLACLFVWSTARLHSVFEV